MIKKRTKISDALLLAVAVFVSLFFGCTPKEQTNGSGSPSTVIAPAQVSPDSEDTPVATVPSLPSALRLATPNSSLIVSGSADNLGYVPITGYPGAIDTSSCPLGSSCEVTLSGGNNTASCPPNTDGSFQCYLPNGTTGMSLSIYYSDQTHSDQTSLPATDISNPLLLWMTETPIDLQEANGNLYTVLDMGVVNPYVVKSAGNGSTWIPNGAYFDHYLNFISNGTLAFHSTYSLFGEMNRMSGVFLGNLTAGNVTDTGLVSSQPVATEYTIEKYVNGNLMYGIAENKAPEAFLYNALDGMGTFYDPDPHPNSLKFMTSGEKDDEGNLLNHVRTLTFDMNTSGWAIIVYQSENGLNRIRLSNGTTMMGGKTPILGTSHDFKDIGFINEEPLAGRNRALLLDRAQNKVWVLEADTNANNFKPILIPISVGNNPVAMAFNTDRSRLYVVNKDDDTLSTINIPANRNLLPEVVATTRLADLTPGKTISFKPSSLIYQNGYLLVGAEEIKSVVIIDATLLSH